MIPKNPTMSTRHDHGTELRSVIHFTTSFYTLRWIEGGYMAGTRPTVTLVYFTLLHRADNYGRVGSLTIRELASLTGCSNDTVMRAIRKLEHTGAITTASRGEPDTSNSYQLRPLTSYSPEGWNGGGHVR